MNHSLLDYNL